MNNPLLSDIRVQDLSRLLPGPFCSLYLAQMGARTSDVGSVVDESMTDGSAALQVMGLTSLRAYGRQVERGGDTFTGALPNYGIYK